MDRMTAEHTGFRHIRAGPSWGVGEVRKVAAVVLLLAGLAGAPAQAAQTIAQGTLSCGEWTAEHLRDDYGARIQNAWVAGYLSAYSMYADDQEIDLPDPAGRNGWVSNYCRNNPLDKIDKAADQLILELRRRAPKR